MALLPVERRPRPDPEGVKPLAAERVKLERCAGPHSGSDP